MKSPEAISQIVAATPENSDHPKKSQAELRTALEQKLASLKPGLEADLKEYAQALGAGLFADAEGEEAGAGEKRKLAWQNKITAALDRATKMKARLDSGEELPEEPELDLESLKAENQAFLKRLFRIWHGEDRSKVEQIPALVSPRDLDFDNPSSDISSERFGEYTLNPETQHLDWESIQRKIFIPDLSALNGESFAIVAQYLIDNYSDKYLLPGIEYCKFILENPDKTPADPSGVNFKKARHHVLFGSFVRDANGFLDVLAICYSAASLYAQARWLGDTWGESCQAVLFEK